MSAAFAQPAYARQVRKGDAPLPESQRHYFKTPNSADDSGMPPLAFRLYSHYRRVCGDHGVCRQSLRELAGHTVMSHTQVAREQIYLETHNWISIRRVRQRVAEVRTVNIWTENYARYEKAPPQPETVCNGQLQTVTGSYHPPDPPIRTEEPIKEPVKNTPNVSAHPARARVRESERVCPPPPPPNRTPKKEPPPSPSKFSADELREHARRYNLGPGWLTVALRSDRFDAVIDECRARERQQAGRVSPTHFAPAPDASPVPSAPPEDPDLAEAQAEYERNRRELEESARVPPAGATEPAETQKAASGQICANAGGVTTESAPAAGAPRKQARRKSRAARERRARARRAARAVRAQASTGDAPDTPAASGDGGRRDGVSGVPRRGDGARAGRSGALTGPRRHERGPPG